MYRTIDLQGDTIDLTAFKLSGGASIIPTVHLSNFYGSGNSVVVSQVGGNTYVFADVDKNGAFDPNTDLVIKVVGTHESELLGGDIKLA